MRDALDRRGLLRLVAGGVAAGALAPFAERTAGAAPATTSGTWDAVVFDAFPIFDPRPVFALAEELHPGRGAELSAAWRTRQFEYQWLRALAGRYADFVRTTEQGLVHAASQLGLPLPPESRKRLVDAYFALGAWPDVPASLAALKKAGLRLGLLSNMTPALLEAGLRNAGLAGAFEHVLSTDRLRSYKPDPRAYQLALDAFGLPRERILFVAFAGWDAAGARWFGYPTFWVNRLGAPPEELDATPDGVGPGLGDLVRFVEDARRASKTTSPG